MAMATARFNATVDLPTPPLALATATTWRTLAGLSAAVGWAGDICAWAWGDSRAPRRTRTMPGSGGRSADAPVAPVGPAGPAAAVSTTCTLPAPETLRSTA